MIQDSVKRQLLNFEIEQTLLNSYLTVSIMAMWKDIGLIDQNKYKELIKAEAHDAQVMINSLIQKAEDLEKNIEIKEN